MWKDVETDKALYIYLHFIFPCLCTFNKLVARMGNVLWKLAGYPGFQCPTTESLGTLLIGYKRWQRSLLAWWQSFIRGEWFDWTTQPTTWLFQHTIPTSLLTLLTIFSSLYIQSHCSKGISCYWPLANYYTHSISRTQFNKVSAPTFLALHYLN